MYFLKCAVPQVTLHGMTYYNPPVNFEKVATFHPDRMQSLNVPSIRFLSAHNHRLAEWKFESTEQRDEQLAALDQRLCSRV